MEIIDLKQRKDFLQQYVDLRNSYAELLLTNPVSTSDTKEWIKQVDVEIRGVVKDRTLCGVAILYVDKGGEVSFFAERKGEGVGSKLLEIIEGVAKEKGLKSIWAYVLQENKIARRVFEKNGYSRGKMTKKSYQGILRKGIEYKKFIT